MIACKLGNKAYTVDYVSGRALREIEPALTMYARIARATSAAIKGEALEDGTSIADALDVMAKWFCLLFGNQFTPDELYDGYPADRLMHDMVLAILAVQGQATGVLSQFPTTAAAQEQAKETTS